MNPAARRPGAHRDVRAGSSSMRSSRSRARRALLVGGGERVDPRRPLLVGLGRGGVGEGPQVAAAPLQVRHEPPVDQDDERARGPGGPGRAGRPGECRPVGLGRVGGREQHHRRLALGRRALGAQAVDRSGQRELRRQP